MTSKVLGSVGVGRAFGWLRAAGLFGALAGFGMAACDEAPSEKGLAVALYTAPGAPDPFENVGFLRVLVEGDGLSQAYEKVVSFSSEGSASLEGIPFGNGRQVTIEGWTRNASGKPGAVVSRGRSVRARVQQGGGEQALNVLMARVNSIFPMADAVQRAPQALSQGRVGHTVTRTVRGEIVVAGGGTLADASDPWWTGEGVAAISNAVEVIEERTNTRRPHAAMVQGRVWHTGTALETGQVLLAGGWAPVDGGPPVARKDVDVYNPGPTGTVDRLDRQLDKARAGHTATLVDGFSHTILFVGGDMDGVGTYEIWNPLTGMQKRADLPDGSPRRHHQATLFEIPGQASPYVLITGGESDDGPLASALVYDIGGDVMFPLPTGLGEGRTQHTATWVESRGYIYLAGGFTALDRSAASSAISVYDIGNNVFQNEIGGFQLATPRGGHTAAALPRNGVLLAGGVGPGGALLGDVEVIHEFLDPTNNIFVIAVAPSAAGGVPYLPQFLAGAQAASLESGMALLVGGIGTDGAGALTHPTNLLLFNPE